MILVTGATGFVGNAVVQTLIKKNDQNTLAVALRQSGMNWPPNVMVHIVSGLSSSTDWSSALKGIDVVVHCAARVHVMHDQEEDSLAEYRRVNVEGTLELARQAATAGVRRFVFLSSIKVNGEMTSLNQLYTADDKPAPIDPYGISKYEAEQGLRKLASQAGMEVVIIRPPLVYGAGIKANFRSMMHWLYKGIPLPFGAIHNKRSLVGLDNLVDLIITCTEHPAAANQIFLVSDGEDMSTTDLLKRTAIALQKQAKLIPVPQSVLEFGLKLLKKNHLSQRLLGSLQVDISKTRELLGWVPPVSINEGLRKTADAFLLSLHR
jgi:nucleoside-diphosphate-sugar epimerase